MVAAAVDTPEKMVGRPIKRREDPRLITGAGNYLDDVRLPGMTYAALVRSPHAHAKIVSVDTSAAASMPGVIGVFTGDDFMDIVAFAERTWQNSINLLHIVQGGFWLCHIERYPFATI